MPINQPIISDDQADNSWKLEATEQANREEARVNSLVARIATLERLLSGTTTGFNPDAIVSAGFDSTSVTAGGVIDSSRRGNLLFTQQDGSVDRLDLNAAISNIAAINTGTIKAQTFTTTDNNFSINRVATGTAPNELLLDATRNPVESVSITFAGTTFNVDLAAGALPPRSAFFATIFNIDDAAQGALRTDIHWVGMIIRPSVLNQGLIIVPLDANGMEVFAFTGGAIATPNDSVPRIRLTNGTAGTFNLVANTFAITNESGIRRE